MGLLKNVLFFLCLISLNFGFLLVLYQKTCDKEPLLRYWQGVLVSGLGAGENLKEWWGFARGFGVEGNLREWWGFVTEWRWG